MIETTSDTLAGHLTLVQERFPLLAWKLREVFPQKFLSRHSLELPLVGEGAFLILYRSSSLRSIAELAYYVKSRSIHLMLIEKTAEEMVAFLSDPAAGELLCHPRFSCMLVEDWNEEISCKIAWENVFLEKQVVSAFVDEEEFQRLKTHIQEDTETAFLSASEYRDYGLAVTRNVYQHLKDLPGKKQGKSLQFKNIPALICGAGPSLALQKDLLEAFQHRALIFVGGALLAAQELAAEGAIKPHFGALVDPDPPYERFKQGVLFEMPLLYQARLSYPIFQLMQGEKIFFPGGEIFSIVQLCTEELIEQEKLGWNVANVMATWAAEMGCNPIILVGMDMCYAPGHEYGVSVVGEEFKEILWVKDRSGNSVASRRDLLRGKQYFSELVERYPEQTFINATAQGLSIENMQEESLAKILQKLPMSYDLQGLVHSQLMECLSFSQEMPQIEKNKKQLMTSFQRTQQILMRMLSQLEKRYLHQKENPSKTHSAGLLALEESDLEEELAYQIILEPIWQVWKWLLFRHEQEKINTEEGLLHKVLFFQRVIQEHQALLSQSYAR